MAIYIGWGMNRVSMSVTAKGKRWEILHSLWIGWTLFTLGFLCWIAFLYIGIRTRQRKWILWAVVYSVPFCLSGLLSVIFGPSADVPNQVENVGVALAIAVWGVSAIHAFRV